MLKQPATYDEQIEKLREHGCEVTDETFCKEVLSQVSYYRLSAYFLPFRTSRGQYRHGTTFVKIYNLYEFDRKLRRMIFSVIEELEVYLRTQLSYYHTHKYGADGYRSPANFNSRHNHDKFNERITELIKGNINVPFVKHHMNNYNEQFPLWVISELFTFGMLSYFYADMTTADQKYIARNILGTSVTKAKSWLYCCTDLRNICAHYCRLYYTIFSAAPAQVPGVDIKVKRSLYAAIMALRSLYQNKNKWNDEFLPFMIELFEEYSDVIELRHIGFPNDWKDKMFW